jgi:membrane associated rhomboid family serine protease
MSNADPALDETPDPWWPRWHDYVLPAALVLLMVISYAFQARPEGMVSWGVSAAILAGGDYENVALHLFAHGSLLHLTFNCLALLEIGGLVVARLGSFPGGWLRAMAGFVASGLSSMIFFLSLHPAGSVALIGASGAIYGLIGLLLTVRLIDEVELVRFRQLPIAFGRFLNNNRLFLALLIIGAVLAGTSARIASEAHLGGLLGGIGIASWLLPRAAPGPRQPGAAPGV